MFRIKTYAFTIAAGPSTFWSVVPDLSTTCSAENSSTRRMVIGNVLSGTITGKTEQTKTKAILNLVLYKMGNDHLIEFQLIEIVFFHLIESFNNESLIFYHLIKFFETFQLIESFNNVILSYFKLSINCQKRTYGFWQLIKSF